MHSPVAVRQIRTVLSYEAVATSSESCEKATDSTSPLWPSSVCRHAFQLSSIAGLVVSHFGSLFSNSCLVRLRTGLNTSAEAWI